MDDLKELTQVTPEEAQANREKVVDNFFEFLRYIFMAGLDNPTEEDAEFAKALIENVRRQVVNGMEIGQDKGFSPIANLSVWCKQTGVDGLDFTYRLESIGGAIYEGFNLANLIDKLDKAMGAWGKETYGADEVDQSLIGAWSNLKKESVH